jgi:hypothetical protein
MGTAIRMNLNESGERVFDKYVVQFADNDQEEYWGIQLEGVFPRAGA